MSLSIVVHGTSPAAERKPLQLISTEKLTSAPIDGNVSWYINTSWVFSDLLDRGMK
jgi:hypothetical protein